jgi:hypothetical protein
MIKPCNDVSQLIKWHFHLDDARVQSQPQISIWYITTNYSAGEPQRPKGQEQVTLFVSQNFNHCTIFRRAVTSKRRPLH